MIVTGDLIRCVHKSYQTDEIGIFAFGESLALHQMFGIALAVGAVVLLSA